MSAAPGPGVVVRCRPRADGDAHRLRRSPMSRADGDTTCVATRSTPSTADQSYVQPPGSEVAPGNTGTTSRSSPANAGRESSTVAAVGSRCQTVMYATTSRASPGATASGAESPDAGA